MAKQLQLKPCRTLSQETEKRFCSLTTSLLHQNCFLMRRINAAKLPAKTENLIISETLADPPIA